MSAFCVHPWLHLYRGVQAGSRALSGGVWGCREKQPSFLLKHGIISRVGFSLKGSRPLPGDVFTPHSCQVRSSQGSSLGLPQPSLDWSAPQPPKASPWEHGLISEPAHSRLQNTGHSQLPEPALLFTPLGHCKRCLHRHTSS